MSINDIHKLVSQILNNVPRDFINIFKPRLVSGYLDDLLGQQYFLIFILLLSILSVLFLTIAYILNTIIYVNKDYILSKFDNKYLIFYIKYQSFFIKISLVYLPILLILSIFLCIKITYYLVCHPIPFENLEVNLHVWISNKDLYKN